MAALLLCPDIRLDMCSRHLSTVRFYLGLRPLPSILDARSQVFANSL